MSTIEIEIQVQIEHLAPLKAFLEKSAQFTGERQQIDEYYSPAHKDYLATKPVAEWLRLRQEGDRQSVTYKKWYYEANGKSTHADEYETSVAEVDKLRLIFQALDIKHLITVNKLRRTYRYEDYEIALDSIEGLGDFIEVEYKGQTPDEPKKITTGMVEFLKKQGVGKVWRNYVGYPYQMLFPKEVVLDEL